MDDQAELRGFLTSRRARLSPEEAGMAPFPGLRRVPGLRREEVAYLAGISADYYTRLERGRLHSVSTEVLDAVSRALSLNEVEHDHFLSLVQAVGHTPLRPRRRRTRLADDDGLLLQRVVDAVDVPAYIQNRQLDVLAANDVGWALFPHAEDEMQRNGRPFNLMRFQVLDPRAQDFLVDWEESVIGGVALLRDAAARERDNTELFALIGELSSKSQLFRTAWASHNVLRHRRARKHYRHPVVGELHFESASFTLDNDPSRTLIVYSVEPSSTTHDALRILGSLRADGPASRSSASDSQAPSAQEHT